MTRDDSIQSSPSRLTGNTAAAPNAAPRRTVLLLLTALSVLPINIYLPALPNIAATFQVDFALVNLSIAGYAIINALTEIIAGAMSDRYGRRPVALIAVSIFIIASIGCALAPNVGVFLLCRVMQASIAACFCVALVVIKETAGERRAANRIGYAAMGWAIAPMLGPTFGGVLDEMFGWRAIFVALALLGAVILAISMRELKETAGLAPRPRGSYFASYGQLLGSSRFWAYTLCMACSTGTLYIFLGGASLAASSSFGGSSAKLGFFMGMVPAGFILGSYLAARLAGKSLSTTLVIARLSTCIGLLLGLTLSITGVTHVLAFFGPCIFIGIGNGMTFPAANLGVMSVRSNLAGTAAGLAAAMSIAGGALIASIAGLLLRETGAIPTLFVLLLTSASLALSAALFAAFVDRRGANRVPDGEGAECGSGG
ncbi:MFS transporter [Rhizobium lentis]|uniref:MFS transporter n=1 Tax=Rhizobium lentis TaxID=1138194 RepID=A0A9Q3M766_9HYPH|nr:MFS transporter [Rhizobium lentis]MBX4957127.1 MFS transporter [Rhizobium lentis]MBX4975293.1 MFS transporter [Rhizobium lentis]MBX4987117.1 MFS transporter [Rhizobium lentis]MBX5005561.1 MFS transporter [Rhizobium lentis]MBX5021779.1 MFS transporter [Rhizobium lentis]